jgi:hypothetical protein
MIKYDISDRGLKLFQKLKTYTNFITLTWLFLIEIIQMLIHEELLKEIEWCSFISIGGIEQLQIYCYPSNKNLIIETCVCVYHNICTVVSRVKAIDRLLGVC